MKNPIFYLLLAVGALGSGACQKLAEPDDPRPTAASNPQHLSVPPNNAAVIDQTRAWFEGRFNDPTVLDVSVAKTKPLNWAWANVELDNSGNAIITVPEEDYFTRPTYANGMNPNGCRSLVFMRNAQGQYRTAIMELRPDREYIWEKLDLIPGADPLNLRPMISPGDYWGWVLYYDGVDGQLKEAMRYESGKAVSQLYIPLPDVETKGG